MGFLFHFLFIFLFNLILFHFNLIWGLSGTDQPSVWKTFSQQVAQFYRFYQTLTIRGLFKSLILSMRSMLALANTADNQHQGCLMPLCWICLCHSLMHLHLISPAILISLRLHCYQWNSGISDWLLVFLPMHQPIAILPHGTEREPLASQSACLTSTLSTAARLPASQRLIHSIFK